MRKLNTLFLKLRQKALSLCYDLLAIPAAWYLAYWLRYNLKPFPSGVASKAAIHSLLVLVLIQISCYYYFKVYRGIWKFASLNDIARIIKASLSALGIVIPVLYLLATIHHIPRSVLPLYAMILTTIWSSGRLLRRFYWDNRHKPDKSQARKRVLVVGAGDAGASLIRDLKRSPEYEAVGIIDDYQSTRSIEVHGVKVVGATRDLVQRTHQLNVDLIFIAIPSATSLQMRLIVTECERSKVPFRTLPSLAALADGRVEINALRAVSLEDILGRDEVQLDREKITNSIQGKRILVTGGAGSIGAELCRQILKFKPAELLLVDHAEYQLYLIEQELLKLNTTTQLHFVLASVTDKIAITHWFQLFQPEIVFHAAAFKHVPLLETRIRSAVLNNVIGTHILAETSVATHVEKFILISTDKAVNPTNVMGATKRIAEVYCQNLNERVETQFITVRFGNVLGSTGSVVPLFQQQIQSGGPVTVTHPDIERYFMTIPEAAQLILQAMVNGRGGEIFVLDMGEPIKIKYLAEQMIRLSGKDIEIVYTGLRPGEKLYEELFHAEEPLSQTVHAKLYQAAGRASSWIALEASLNALTEACHQFDEHMMRKVVHDLVPEFQRVLGECALGVH